MISVAMFQSTPVITDGRTAYRMAAMIRVAMFQSTPVITDGRTSRPRCLTGSRASFNPRPSSLTGEPRSEFSVHQ